MNGVHGKADSITIFCLAIFRFAACSHAAILEVQRFYYLRTLSFRPYRWWNRTRREQRTSWVEVATLLQPIFVRLKLVPSREGSASR